MIRKPLISRVHNNGTKKCTQKILKLVYVHNELLHVSANHVAIFRDVE